MKLSKKKLKTHNRFFYGYSLPYFPQDWISSKPLKAYSITVSVRAPTATQLVATA